MESWDGAVVGWSKNWFNDGAREGLPEFVGGQWHDEKREKKGESSATTVVTVNSTLSRLKVFKKGGKAALIGERLLPTEVAGVPVHAGNSEHHGRRRCCWLTMEFLKAKRHGRR